MSFWHGNQKRRAVALVTAFALAGGMAAGAVASAAEPTDPAPVVVVEPTDASTDAQTVPAATESAEPTEPAATESAEPSEAPTEPAVETSAPEPESLEPISPLAAVIGEPTVGLYDQCSNDDGAGGVLETCNWINGNLNNANSTYYEHDATPQRLWLRGMVPGSSHTVTLSYGTTKGGKHAYDFLTSYNHSESWITLADRCSTIDGCETAGFDTETIPADPENTQSMQVGFMEVRGGSISNIGQPDLVKGTYAGDSETEITVSFTVDDEGSEMCETDNQGAETCGIALFFGAHVASAEDWGPGSGAASISGSPYHVALAAVDNESIGERDNQMASNAVVIPPSGTIVIAKSAGGAEQDFTFSLSDGTDSTPFTLDDDGADPTYLSSQSFTVEAGTYTATEDTVSGWALSNLVCVDPTSNTTVSLANRQATINVASDETVTCTFTNISTVLADLTVAKTATESYIRDYNWEILKTADDDTLAVPEGTPAIAKYTVDVTRSEADSDWKVDGTVTVSNPNPYAISITGVSDETDQGGTCALTETAPSAVAANGTAEVDYACLFNTKPADGTNTATVTWEPDVTVGAITYSTPNSSDDGTAAFSFTGVNPSSTTDASVWLDDPMAPESANFPREFTATDSVSYEVSLDEDAGTCTDVDNTATLYAEEALETEVDESTETVEVCVGAAPTIEKTAAGTYDRTYDWEITKAVDRTTAQATGGTATFNYTVTATPDGYVDSGWALAGTITVTNPNDWQDVTVDVSDSLPNGGTCLVEGTTTHEVTVAASKSEEVAYACTFTSLAEADYTMTNTASIDWAGDTAFIGPAGPATGTAEATLTLDEAINDTVSVVDDKTTGSPVELGTAAWSGGAKEFKYALDLAVSTTGCATYGNTAQVIGDGSVELDFATASVSVCQPAFVTDSMLCTFDLSSVAGDDFRLLYSRDKSGKFTLNASNPGQFYLNGIFALNGGETLTYTVPEPFVTQGTMPVHLYSSFQVVTSGGRTCFIPGTELLASGQYVNGTDGGTVTVTVPDVPDGTLVYANLHLDYGHKGTSGWTKSGTSAQKSGITITSPQSYDFEMSDGVSTITDTVVSVNTFK